MPSHRSHRRNKPLQSVELSPTSSRHPAYPYTSPYRDEFSLPPTPHAALPAAQPPKTPYISRDSVLTTFLNRFRYTKLSSQPNAVETQEVDEEDEEQGYERKPRFARVHLKDEGDRSEDPSDRWFTVLFLLLLLSALFNAFLLFNGPPNNLPRHPKGKNEPPVPHKSFTISDHGKNYTCYETRTQTFERVYEYESLEYVYDHFWDEVLGQSKGFVYTKLNREDGKVRKARLAIFHQLNCLARIRNAVQRRYRFERERRKDIVWLEDGLGDGEMNWAHCFDYLRQVVLCNANDSVETSNMMDGKWTSHAWGSKKVCRNPEWLYNVTSCGEQGCEGEGFYQEDEQMKKIQAEEKEEMTKAGYGAE